MSSAAAIAPPRPAVEPLYKSVPSYVFTSGPEVCDLNEMVGYPADANQAMVLDVIFAEDERTLPAAFETEVVAARQNIKTGLMKQASMGWMFLTRARRIVYSAHEWNPACAEMFRDMKDLVDSCAWTRRRVRKVYEANGEEAIVLVSGAMMLFRTRMRNTARSLAGDKLILDEDFATEEEHQAALIPILSTRPEAQILRGSSAGKATSSVLRDVRDRGRAGSDPSLAYFEWAAPPPAQACDLGERCDHGRGTPGCGCDKPEYWRMANPALGIRISEDYIGKERRSLSPRMFARERMVWWDAPIVKAVEEPPVPLDEWAATEDVCGMLRATAFAVEVALDRSTSVIAAAGPAPVSLVRDVPAKRTALELIEYGPGTAWVLARCLELDAEHGPVTFAVDGGGPAAPLIESMQEAGLDVTVLDTAAVAAAFGGLVDALNQGAIAHGPDPTLQAAVEGAKKRNIGERGFGAKRRNAETDVIPLNAIAFAHHARDVHAGFFVY